MPPHDGRRRFLRRTAVVLGVGAGCGGRQSSGDRTATRDGTASPATTGTPTPAPTDAPGVGVETLATGLADPTDATVAGGRLLVADRPGQVYAVGETADDPVLDLSDRLVALADGPDERGLLGIAAHPDDGRLFVRYSAPTTDASPVGYSHRSVLATVRLDASPPAASERVLLTVPQPQSNNNGGPLAFGPGGHLFLALGDGGGVGDVGRGHAEDWYERVRGGNGQDLTENRLGSVLRIDVDAGGDGEYAVPPDNPLLGTDGFDEQYAWGFRNPQGLAFVDGSLVVADRGQERHEEVNVVERGENYGWNVHEGPDCFDPSAPTEEPAGCPSHTLAGDQLLDPVLSYPHPDVADGDGPTGVGVVGGHRYRGPKAELAGKYVFADRRAEGRLFVADPGDSWALSTVPVRGDFGRYVTGFARDGDALYVLTTDRRDRTGGTGAVRRL